MDHATYFRWVLLVASILIVIFCTGIYIVAFRKMVLPEKIFGGAVLCFMFYIMDALKAAIMVDLGFAMRLLLLAVGEFLFVAWLLEPIASRKNRQGNSWIRRRSEGR